MLSKSEILKEALTAYETFGLTDLDNKNLLSRFDTKFVMNIDDVPGLLESMLKDYSILEIQGDRAFNYSSLYFDTLQRQLYLDHHNNKLWRQKIRFREYLDSGTTYLEVKNKYNNNQTVKERCQVDCVCERLNECNPDFLEVNTEYSADKLLPALNVKYNRITLLHNTRPEKITLDSGIEFTGEDFTTNTNGLVIVEKKSKKPNRSDFDDRIIKHNAKKIRISKYCLGTLLTNESIKYNRFKNKLLTLNKVCNGHFVFK